MSSQVEDIKTNSNFLRGTLSQGLQDDVTGALGEQDTQLTKFHGIYQQDDRDLRAERKKQKLEPAYQFMIRARVPGGRCTPGQWLAMDNLADAYADGSLRLTTRQAFQFHGVLKRNLKASIRGINDVLMDTLAACGDVNRNVMCHPNPKSSRLHVQALEWADRLSEHFTPQTSAYHEIWLDKTPVASTKAESEPIYGQTYLPRKFKMGIAIPPSNDVDIYSQDLGLIAIAEDEQIVGFNVVVGGGMGCSHGDDTTYPRLGTDIGFCTVDAIIAVSEAIITTQRDFGNRDNRKRARLKYTIDDRGIDWFKRTIEDRSGVLLTASKPVRFDHNQDRYGWQRGYDNLWHLTLFIENGRVKDSEKQQIKGALREIASLEIEGFLLTPNQNLQIVGADESVKLAIDKILNQHGVLQQFTSVRANSMACVGFPTCGLAMAESERYLPELISKIEKLLAQHNLSKLAPTIRMTGCPNGCARPYLAEIALVGKAPGRYNLYLGGDEAGARLNQMYRENVNEAETLNLLDNLFAAFAADGKPLESWSNFVKRTVITN